jgi:maltose/moltooligosaccharide transporter
MQPKKPLLSFWQIINMNVGFFGIQYSFGLQQSAVNPIYDFLGARPEDIPILNLAGPLTGLIIQPIIGALSDKTWHPRFGRRKPYFFIGAVLCSIALFLFPFSSALWMAVGLLWILDAGNNTAMEPYRAFIADKLDAAQQPIGFQAQSFFTGFGQTLANVSLFIFPAIILGYTGKIPNWVFASFFVGAVCSVGSVLWSMRTTPEIPPTEEELAVIKKRNEGMPHPALQFFFSIITTVIAYLTLAVLLIPSLLTGGRIIRNLIQYTKEHKSLKIIFAQNIEIVEASQYAQGNGNWHLFICSVVYFLLLAECSKSIALSVYNATPEKAMYEKLLVLLLVNGWYIVTFLSAFALSWFAKAVPNGFISFVLFWRVWAL